MFFPAVFYLAVAVSVALDELDQESGSGLATVDQLFRGLRKKAAIAGDKAFLTWLNQHKDLVISAIWKELPRNPATLWNRFRGFAAPALGDRGYVEPEPRPGNTSLLAQNLMWRMRSLLEDPDLYSYLAEHLDEDGDQHPDLDSPEALLVIADYVGVPHQDATGAPLDDWDRIELASTAMDLATESTETWWGTTPLEVDPRYETRGEQERGWVTKYKRGKKGEEPTPYEAQLGPRPPNFNYGPLASGVAEAVLADAMSDADGLRLVAVDRDVGIAFMERYHSKLPEYPDRTMFLLGAMYGDRLVAVATAGHPSGRWADQQNVLELTRVASDGTVKNAASMLTARIMDLLPVSGRGDPGKPLTFATYSLTSEAGSTYQSLADKGLRPTVFKPGSKHKEPGGRRQTKKALAGLDKIRWEAGPGALPADWGLLDRLQNRLYRPYPLEPGWLIGYEGFIWDRDNNLGLGKAGADVPLKLNYVHEAPWRSSVLVPRFSTALENVPDGSAKAVLVFAFNPGHIIAGQLYDVSERESDRARVNDPELPEATVSEALVIGIRLYDAAGNLVHERQL